mgnify:CR=1 FL=1
MKANSLIKLFLITFLTISLNGCYNYNYGYKSININPEKGFILSFPNSSYSVDSIVIEAKNDSIISKRILETKDIFITKNGEKIFRGEKPFTGIISDYREYTKDTLHVVDRIPSEGVLKIYYDEFLITKGYLKNSRRVGDWHAFSLEGDTVASKSY